MSGDVWSGECVCCGAVGCVPEEACAAGHPHCYICWGRGHEEDCLACEYGVDDKAGVSAAIADERAAAEPGEPQP